MSTSSSPAKIAAELTFKHLAKVYVMLKRPTVIAVAGSVGKTSTKLMLKHLISSEKHVSCMDDSYNNGLGLYLSVFEKKVPANLNSPLAWSKLLLSAVTKFLLSGPDILILEYGIDHPGDMDELIKFIRPDVSILTAATPEHMEYMKTIDAVGEEETKVIRGAKQFAVVNQHDVDRKYLLDIDKMMYLYGEESDHVESYYYVTRWLKTGAEINLSLDGQAYDGISVQFVSEALIRQLVGAALLAKKVGISDEALIKSLATATPAASRMRLFAGLKNSVLIDDTTNFSPVAGISAIRALARIPANRHIAVLGNMHELGDYAEEGYRQVSNEFKDLDAIVLVGQMSIDMFTPLAVNCGFSLNSNLFHYGNAVEAGLFLASFLAENDAVLVKGPFGGFYLEETVKRLLQDPADAQYLTRQSDFWIEKKRQHFGANFDK